MFINQYLPREFKLYAFIYWLLTINYFNITIRFLSIVSVDFSALFKKLTKDIEKVLEI